MPQVLTEEGKAGTEATKTKAILYILLPANKQTLMVGHHPPLLCGGGHTNCFGFARVGVLFPTGKIKYKKKSHEMKIFLIKLF